MQFDLLVLLGGGWGGCRLSGSGGCGRDGCRRTWRFDRRRFGRIKVKRHVFATTDDGDGTTLGDGVV